MKLQNAQKNSPVRKRKQIEIMTSIYCNALLVFLTSESQTEKESTCAFFHLMAIYVRSIITTSEHFRLHSLAVN